MNWFKKLFKTEKPIIGMIHLPPLLGYEGFPGYKLVKQKTKREAKTLEKGGVHAIMIENNYDIPHKIFVDPEITAIMTSLTQMVVENVKIPVGINVLWNDYKSALGICAVTGAKFIRIPAFVDDVRTKYGDARRVANKAIPYRKKLGLEDKVFIMADVQVKHSKMINQKKPLSLSVKQAINKGADAIIVTGKWTADPPTLKDLKEVKVNGKNIPILVGSGSTPKNIAKLLQLVDGIIVGTSIIKNKEVNKEKLKKFMSSYKNFLNNHPS